ncbi:MAG: PAS domain S-box protein [Pyrinomonadaceae bacterium]
MPEHVWGSTLDDSNLERSARELEYLREALAESTIVAVTDAKGKIIYVNDHFCRISKYSREELIGKDHRIINSGTHSKEFFRELWTTIQNGETWRGEICNRAKDGEKYWVSTTIVPYLDENSKPYQYVAIRHDISFQKQTEEKLREQRDLLEQTYNAISVWSLEDGVAYWNRSAERLYGYGHKEMLGKKIFEVLETEFEEGLENYLGELRENGYWEGVVRQKTRDGRTLFVESRQVVRNPSEEFPVVLETSRDVTRQRSDDERIRQQASLLEKSRDAILVCDLNLKVIFWNVGAVRTYGWEVSEALGRDIRELAFGDDNKSLITALENLEHADEWQDESIHIRKSGEQITVISRWTRVRNESGQPDYYLIVNTDISELKNTERQLILAQRLESIGTLAGGMAHDLNNSLSPILMAVEMLENDLDLGEEAAPWLKIIRENTERSADLIKKVLVFARGGRSGTRQVIDPSMVANDVVNLLKTSFPKGVEIDCEISDGVPLINADRAQIDQVLTNLAVNAKDALVDGKGRIILSVKGVVLSEKEAKRASLGASGEFAIISVADNGSGISDENLGKIWDPFFTTKDVGRGTGLGLSTSLSIIKAHGGSILVETGECGTEFRVVLPAAREIEESSISAEKVTVLVVDDEAPIAHLAVESLKRKGIEAASALGGKQALEILSRKNSIEVVVTDMAMPEIDGPALIREIKKLNPKIRLIGITGNADTAKYNIENLGLHAFLEKPLSGSEMAKAVEGALSNRSVCE